MSTIQVEIVSAEERIFSGEAQMVYAPAVMGEVGIAPRHTPLISPLKPGEVRLDMGDGKEEFFFISGGILEVQPHLVTVKNAPRMRSPTSNQISTWPRPRLNSPPRPPRSPPSRN
jgi:ATP synthase F1 epsilon subunit